MGVIFDALDGYVARKSGKVTKFGAFFDSTVDRISDFLCISAFGFAGVIPWWLVSLALVTSFLISYTKARGEHVFPDVVITAGIMQRSERLLAVFIIFIAVLVKWSEIVLVLFYIFILLNTITVWQRISIVKKQL